MKQSSWHAERFLNHALFDILPHTCILQVSDNSHTLQVSAIAVPRRIEPTPARARNARELAGGRQGPAARIQLRAGALPGAPFDTTDAAVSPPTLQRNGSSISLFCFFISNFSITFQPGGIIVFSFQIFLFYFLYI